MKRYITILLVAMAVCGTAVANNDTQEILGAKVTVRDFKYQADSVKVDIDLNLKDLEIGANKSAVFTPTIEKGDYGMDLNTVVVKRRGGARLYKRAVRLDNTKSIEKYEKWYGTPYKEVKFYGAKREQNVRYSVMVPYQTWMVDSKLNVDCATCGCCFEDKEGQMTPDDNVLNIDIPHIKSYRVTPQVELIKPEKVAVKRRDIQYSAALIFKVNSTIIDPNLAGNSDELASIDEMMQSVMSDEDYTITKVNIIGYASPEGRLATNMRLSEGRAKGLENHMKRQYKSLSPSLYNVRFGGENWDKLYDLVKESDIQYRDDVLSVIDNYTIDEGRESKLMALNGGVPYKYLLKNVFPATRIVMVDVEYNVDAYDLVRIGELIDTKPQNLSLEEMYRLSETYEMDDDEFEKIFMTAVQIYPNDEVALNNALVTEIRKGNIDELSEIAERVDPETESAELANSLGAYYMLVGDYEASKSMLQRAIDLGSSRAEYNMQQLNTKLENIQQIEAGEEFRAKIYGE